MARQSWFNGIFFGDATYGDDFNPEENYLSVGFRPGYALQSRELLEIQNNILYQLSATNRSLFKHGEPRIDIEEESLSDSDDSPITVTVDGNTFTFKRNIQLFTNFSLPRCSQAYQTDSGLLFQLTIQTLTIKRRSHFLPPLMRINSGE